MDERARRRAYPTFDEWLEDIRAEANRHGWHAPQRHVEEIQRLRAGEVSTEWGVQVSATEVERIPTITRSTPYLARALTNRGAYLVTREIRTGPWTAANATDGVSD